MPLFFFHLTDGAGLVPDEEGLELEDWDAARACAVKGARSILAASVLEGRLDLRGHIDVTKACDGSTLRVSFKDVLDLTTGEAPLS